MKTLADKWGPCPACRGRRVRARDQETKQQLICSCGARFLPRPAVAADSHLPALRVAIVADSHFDRRPNGRLAECVAIHDWIAADMDRRRIDLALLSGDLYEGDSAPAERNPAATWVQRVAAGRPVVVVRGNHDPFGDLEILSRLQAKHPIIVEERYGVHRVRAAGVEVSVAAMAYPRKGWLLATAEAKSHRDTSADAAEALQAVLRGMGLQLRDTALFPGRLTSGPRILLTHAMVRGSVTSTGQPLIGMDMEVGLEDLGLAGADVVALGHVHKHQHWAWNGRPVIYPGSPRRTRYGEREGKGYVVLYFDLPDGGRARLRDWAWIPTPAQRMIHTEERWTTVGEGLGWEPLSDPGKGIELLADVEDDVPGADIRYRYHAEEHLRESAAAAAKARKAALLAAGAARVQLDPVIAPAVRTRSEAFAAARSLPDKLGALWEERKLALTEEQRGRALSKLEQLEEEVPR